MNKFILVFAMAATVAKAAAPNCQDFIQAKSAKQVSDMMDYSDELLQRFDEADMSRGCDSAVSSVFNNYARSNRVKEIQRYCMGNPNQTLYGPTRAIYGLMRMVAKGGFGDHC